jgi:hypothetical protein
MKQLTLSNGEKIDSRSVIIAGGLEFRSADFPGAQGSGVVVGDGKALTKEATGGNALVVGGSNGAAQAALGAATKADHVYLMSRSPITKGMSDYQVSAVRANSKITVIEGDNISKLVRDHAGNPQTIETTGGKNLKVKAVGLFLGSVPETSWVPASIDRDKAGRIHTSPSLETSMPGVYAVGDMREGAIGRIGVAVGEGQLALRQASAYLETKKAEHLEKLKETVKDAVDWIAACFKLDHDNPYFGSTLEGVKPGHRHRGKTSDATGAYAPGHPFYGNQYTGGSGTERDPHSGIEKVQLGERKYPVRDTGDKSLDPDHFSGAAVVEKNGILSIFHIADNPERAEQGLKGDLMRFGNVGDDLGPGFYGSAMPQIWASRSAGKWDFLKSMTPEQTKAYVGALRQEVGKQRSTGYITQNELENAERTLGHVEQGKLAPDAGAVLTAEQPYNIRSWTPDFLGKVGIEPSKPPTILKVNLKGRFVDLTSGGFSNKDLETARHMGFEGAYTKNSFSHTAQLVVWKQSAIQGVTRAGHQRDEDVGHPFRGNQYVAGISGGGQKVYQGQQKETRKQLSKLETGTIGEEVAAAYLYSTGVKDIHSTNVKGNNYPVDLVGDHRAFEVKAGLVSNGYSAQQWRTTIGQPGPSEQKALAKMSPERKAAWNEAKAQEIMDRKNAALKEQSKIHGEKLKAQTIGVIIDPDRQAADIYHFDGFHARIGWNTDQAKKGYIKTVKYRQKV